MSDFRYETVTSKIVADGVRKISLNRPDVLNAMNPSLIADLAQAFEDANIDCESRALILTGEGRAFCAGDDRKAHRHPESENEARQLTLAIQRVTRAISLGEKPVVGAINGWAVGGGFEWAINCDFPIWAESAKGFFPEVSLNLFVTGGVTSLLPAMVGLNKAREMLFFGERYSAAELLELGVAWRMVGDEQLQSEALTVAQKLANLPPLSVRAMKRVLNQSAFQNLNNALDWETEATIAGFMDPQTTKLLQDF